MVHNQLAVGYFARVDQAYHVDYLVPRVALRKESLTIPTRVSVQRCGGVYSFATATSNQQQSKLASL